MEKQIVYRTENGGVAIIVPASNVYANSEGKLITPLKGEAVPDGFEPVSIEQIAQKDVPPGIEYKIVDATDIPTDREFRAAWTFDLEVDMQKARSIHMDKIRARRNEKLDELDKRKYGAEYDTMRQRLRDLPQTVDLGGAKTPQELKSVWPGELL